MSRNGEIARAFDLMADILEIQDQNRFRINSYRRAARTIKDLADDVADIAAAGTLRELPGIGDGTAKKITQFLETGSFDELDARRGELPEGLPELLEIPGMGPKKVAVVWKELGVGSLADLKKVIDSEALQALPGFGAQSAKKIIEGIKFLESSGDRVPLGVAWDLADDLQARVAALPGVERVEIAGSVRRGRETAGDIDLLCVASDGPAVIEAFVAFDGVAQVLAAGGTKGSVTVALGERAMQVDLRVVPAESFGAATQYFTGSKDHNVTLREMAIKRGWRLNEWGLYDGETAIAGADERDIYDRLELCYIPPEQREDRGELNREAAFFDTLVRLDDIRGDVHMHTTASDGRCTLEQMAAAARDHGYAYINITDHSKSSVIAGGLTVERMRDHIDAVRAFNANFDGLEVMIGCECDILPDGQLDYPDDVLAACDLVVASIHNAATQDRGTITARTISAIDNPHVDVIGHPTGRLINKRAPSQVDIPEIARAAAATGTALEINASSKRLDLKDRHIEQALEAGALLSINTDSHHTNQLTQMRLGIATARRAGCPRERVVNTFELDALRAWLAR